MSIDRRSFIAASAAASAALSCPAIRAAPKDKKYRTALIGSGWWGMNILREALAAGQTKVVAICDVDQDKLELAAEEVTDLSGDEPKTYGDFRELFEKEDVEIAIIATPDHWHALNALAAIEAGAHLFIEKPTGHTIGESQAIVKAAQASDSVVQVGLHRRIGPHHTSGIRFLREGGAGDIGLVRMFVHSRGGSEAPTKNSPPPEQLDWDMYCGPAPLRPFNRKIHPGGFRHFLDFANGTLGDWGVHWIDQMLMWSEQKSPHTVYSTGGRPIRGAAVLNEDEQTTDAPDSQIATYEFDNFTATWEHRQFGGAGPEKSTVGCHFYGNKGTFHMGWRDGWTFYPADSRKPVIHEESQLQEPDGHNLKLLWADFLKSIESGQKPVADIAIGHQATTLSLLGMLSLKLGRSIRWDGDREAILDDSAATKLLKREYRGPWVYPV
ncbi:Glucose--fructose oxidoreductase precursor [Roseimaritima multifibrata]|uniref:Glucose--fructose oxidoreductase n=1 Tax=Roseimaritima multifibrata TaxID=1930274 RepID=A0A517MF49_9BACT|nr:Gfo/Idh/MocA family oxidoreductase [Roseimaritima multifibrata]QDS93513.1 Glucose--fructose oxidoreductase precursor [Roseimaritima multifibrata]